MAKRKKLASLLAAVFFYMSGRKQMRILLCVLHAMFFFQDSSLALTVAEKQHFFFFFTQYTRNYSDKELMRHYACVKRWWLLSLRTPYNPIQYYRSPCPRAPRPFISPIHTSYSAQHVVCVGLQSMRSTCMCLCTHIRKQTTQLRQKVFRISYVS